jgi:hypothetical protein
LIKKAVDSGLGVVFGNGVCSAIGNLIEASIFQSIDLCLGAFEGNGFEKLIVQSITTPPLVECGTMRWDAKPGINIDELINSDIYSNIISRKW